MPAQQEDTMTETNKHPAAKKTPRRLIITNRFCPNVVARVIYAAKKLGVTKTSIYEEGAIMWMAEHKVNKGGE